MELVVKLIFLLIIAVIILNMLMLFNNKKNVMKRLLLRKLLKRLLVKLSLQKIILLKVLLVLLINVCVLLKESTEFAHLKNDVMHVIKNVKDMTAADIMAVVKDVTNYKLTIDDYLDLMAMWFRDVLMFKSTNDTNYLIFSDEISLIKSQAEVMSYEGIQDILNSIDKVKVRLKANVNFDLCIELLIMAMKEDM